MVQSVTRNGIWLGIVAALLCGACDGTEQGGDIIDAGETMDAGTPDGGGTVNSPFVKAVGTQFVASGQRLVAAGTNFWQGMNLGVADATGDRARLGRELDRLQTLGINNLRVLAASEGPDTEKYRVVPALQPAPGVYNELVFQGLDYFLDQLSLRGMRAVMVLNNYWEWSGGMAQYVSWSDGSAIPYRLDPGGVYNVYIRYVDRFYACASCQTSYQNHIQTVISRVNSINGRLYRDDPTIFSWQLANEPRDYPSTWIENTAKFIKSLDSNHMVTVGSEGTWGGNFKSTHASASIDYATCHIWVENWGKYTATDGNTANLQAATDFALSYLDTHDASAIGLGKPLVLEEFGLARDAWAPTGGFDPATPVTNRDTYYQSLFTRVETLMAARGAIAGDNFWAWGGEARPPSPWAGDPPHETPGWYSVYDQDLSTIALITAHMAALHAFEVPLP